MFILIVTTSKLFIKTKPKFDSIIDQSQANIHQHKIQYEQELIGAKEQIERSLSMMIEKGAIDVKKIISKFSIFNLRSFVTNEESDFMNNEKIK